jgi:UDP-glucose 4-epimerase
LKAAVLGATGFLGSNLVSKLLHNRVDVIAFCRKSHRARSLAECGVQVIEGDLLDRRTLHVPFRDVDWLIHLASTTSPKESLLYPEKDAANIPASRTIFQEATQCGVGKILFGSSGGTVYGDPIRLPVDETHPTQPLIPYAKTKLAVESELTKLCHRTPTQPIILRYGNPYGPNQYQNRGTGVVTSWLESARDGKPVCLFGDGENARDFLYVSDMVEATVSALSKSGVRGVYNIGSGLPTSLNTLLTVIQEITQKIVVVARCPQRPFDLVKAIALDSRRALKDFGWKPRTDLRTGIALTWDWVIKGEPFLLDQVKSA